MLVAIALLILAVLLFGSSAVLGAFGAILGFIAAVAGLAFLAIAAAPMMPSLGLSSDQAVPAIALAIIAFIAIGNVIMAILKRRKR